MCGIFAIWSRAGGLTAADLRPTASLHHRGPDALGRWVSTRGDAALGHARLAIVDLETGDQPMANETETLRVVVSGEFYDYRAIRERLERRGHRLRSRSDSEIVVHLYEDRGLRALDELHGEYAFVLWDEAARELVAVRDRFGVKPLFYAEHGERLYLASEVKALFAADIPRVWNAEAFMDYIDVCFPSDRTLFAGVRQLPPGCILRASPTGVEVSRYWDLDYPNADELRENGGDRRAHVEEVRGVVAEAVHTRLIADVPVGFHLSGGLDSSSILGVAARAVSADAFTVRFDDPAYDESAVARRTASHVGARYHDVPVARESYADHLVEAIRCGEMLQENSHGIARMLQSRRIREQGCTVVLAGEGGDEVFAGYPHFWKDLEVSAWPQARAAVDAGYAKLAAFGMPPHMAVLRDRLGFVPQWIVDRYTTVSLPARALLRPELAGRFADRNPLEPLLDDPQVAAQLEGRTPFHQSVYLFCKTWFCNYILAAERLDMAAALEVRLPFLDDRVFEVAKRTPLEWYRRGAATKYPLREAMRPYVTNEVYSGGKHPFFAPPVVDDERMLGFLRELVRSDAVAANPFFDPARAVHLVDGVAALPREARGPTEPIVQLLAGIAVLGDVYGLEAPG